MSTRDAGIVRLAVGGRNDLMKTVQVVTRARRRRRSKYAHLSICGKCGRLVDTPCRSQSDVQACAEEVAKNDST